MEKLLISHTGTQPCQVSSAWAQPLPQECSCSSHRFVLPFLWLEIRVGIVFCAWGCRWPTPSLSHCAWHQCTQHCHTWATGGGVSQPPAKVCRDFGRIDWRQFCVGVYLVHGINFLPFLTPVNNNSSALEKLFWTDFWPTMCTCEKCAVNMKQFGISATQLSNSLWALAFTQLVMP